MKILEGLKQHCKVKRPTEFERNEQCLESHEVIGNDSRSDTIHNF